MSSSNSKNSYMGQNLRRLPRSELDDSVMRDLNRYDARLSENLRTVDRARDVVLKSLESDKKNFIRGGVTSNKKITKSTSRSPMDTRQASALQSLQHQRYFSDMRTRRAYEQMIMSRRPSTEVINSFKPVRSKTDLTDSRSESKKKFDSVRADDLNNNDDTYRSNSADNDFTTPKEEKRSKSRRTPSKSPNDTCPGARASTTPTIKIDDYDRVSTSPHREEEAKSGVSDMVNGRDKNSSLPTSTTTTTPEMGKRQSSFVTDRSVHLPSTMPLPFSDDFYFGRRQTFWDYLSTPKHPNLNRQKREQLELEFALRSHDTAMAAPKSAKGQRSPPGKGSNTPKTTTTPRAKSSTAKKSGTVTPTTKSTYTSKGKQQ